MEPTTGVEPVDLFLTKEALYQLSYVGSCLKRCAKHNRFIPAMGKWHGAGDESRTRDIQLGRLMLYQLSYSRPKFHTAYSRSVTDNWHMTIAPSLSQIPPAASHHCRKLRSTKSIPAHPRVSPTTYFFSNGGGGRIRTSEGIADRFTVCSLWPLGNPTII
jgi:hypothetical protein